MGSETGPRDAGQPRRGAAAPNYNRRGSTADDRPSNEQAILEDAGLVTSAALAGFDFSTPEWSAIFQRLYPYAIRGLRSWLRKGTIFHKLMKKGIADRIHGEPVELTQEQREDLAHDVALSALEKFRRNVLMKGLWDPEVGTQLTSFFLGYCLMEFPNHYNRLKSQVLSEQNHDQLPEHPDVHQRTDEIATARVELANIIGQCLEDHGEVVLMSAWLEDRPLREAAEQIGISYKAAEYRRSKLRSRLQSSRSA